MFSTLSNLLLHKQMVFGDGNILIFGQPVILTPLAAEVNLLKKLEEKGLGHEIYFSAKQAGSEWFKGMSTIYGMKPQDIMKWGPDLINLGGWGTVKPFKADLSASEFDFTLLNSSMAKGYGPSDHPVDHYFRGLLSGAWETVTNEPIEGIETECLASGGKACKFELRPKAKTNYSSPLVKRQLGME